MRSLLASCLLVAGCFSASSDDAGPPDTALPIIDFAMSTPDLSMMQTDDASVLPDLVQLPDLYSADLTTPGCKGPQDCVLFHATGKCVNGTCAIDFCDLNWGDCDKIVANGCESDSLTDAANCNFCGTSCLNEANAVGVCNNGTCGIGSCNQGFADCDNMVMNGCETATSSDLANCGGCGSICAFANATATCANGKCTFGACNQGFDDCDKMSANGCEVSLQSDDNNCSMCGMVCPMNNPSCEMGVCSPDDFPPIYLLYELEEAE